jgi:hypothetical protein
MHCRQQLAPNKFDLDDSIQPRSSRRVAPKPLRDAISVAFFGKYGPMGKALLREAPSMELPFEEQK